MSDFPVSKELLVECVEQLEEKKVLELAGRAIEEGMDPLELINIVIEGMNRVGQRYEKKDYYIADLIMAGIIFREVLGLNKMLASGSQVTGRNGRVLIGTVKDDIHDIGKEIFRALLEANGFEVLDLGVDVPKELFVKKAQEFHPHILALSGVLTGTLDQMKQVVDAFQQAGLRDTVKILAGANYLSTKGFQYIGADGFATEASSGVEICLAWVNDRARELGESEQ